MSAAAGLRVALCLCPVLAPAADSFVATPLQAPQGNVIRLRAPDGTRQARMGETTVPLYSEPDGTRSGLMPVDALTRPGAYPLEFLGAEDKVLKQLKITVLNAKFRKQNVKLSKSVEEIKASPEEMDAVRAFRKLETEQRTWAEPFAPPVTGCRTSPFGVQRLHNGKPTGNIHAGIDQKAAEGSPIHAVADGTVRLAGMFDLHGGTVGIDHGQGLLTIYLHQSKLAVESGTLVKKGDIVGYAGSTGRSTAPHLHWSIYVNGVPVNPQQWVKVKACSASKQSTRRKK